MSRFSDDGYALSYDIFSNLRVYKKNNGELIEITGKELLEFLEKYEVEIETIKQMA